MIDPNIETMSDGRYRAFAMVGGYSIVYKCEDGTIACAHCLNTEPEFKTSDRKHWNVIGEGIHWEGDALECSCCEALIECSYPED